MTNKLCHEKFYVVTKSEDKLCRTKPEDKLCRNKVFMSRQSFYVMTKSEDNFVVTKFYFVATNFSLCRDIDAGVNQKVSKTAVLDCFQAHFTLGL